MLATTNLIAHVQHFIESHDYDSCALQTRFRGSFVVFDNDFRSSVMIKIH